MGLEAESQLLSKNRKQGGMRMSWQKELASEFNWENDEAVERWLTKLKAGVYAKYCLQNLQLHCEKTGKTPDELITLRVKQIADPDPRVRAEAEDTVLHACKLFLSSRGFSLKIL